MALVVVAALTVSAGVLGFDVIMRLQRVITSSPRCSPSSTSSSCCRRSTGRRSRRMPEGSTAQVVGALVFFLTGFGLGWVNVAADYSRYLPRSASARGVVGWTTFGSSLAPLVLLVMGLLLAGSSPELASADRERSGRRGRDDAADLVPGAVRGGRGARPGGRCGAGHLLVRAGPARGGAARSARGGGGDRRRHHGRRDGVRRVRRGQLPRRVHRVPHHARRARRRLVRGDPRRRPRAPQRLRQQRPLPARGPLRRRPHRSAAAHRRRDRARLGPGHEHRRGVAPVAGLPARPDRRQAGRVGGRQPRGARRPRRAVRRDPPQRSRPDRSRPRPPRPDRSARRTAASPVPRFRQA